MDPAPSLPPLSEKDRAAILIGAHIGITHYALSFASHARDVDLIRGRPGRGEDHGQAREPPRRAEHGRHHRGRRLDLDRPRRPIPRRSVRVRPVLPEGHRATSEPGNRPVYVATNLLESMVTSRTPTIAEANDIANTLLDGVHGLVLAAETAIGIDPLGSVDLVLRAIEAFERASQGRSARRGSGAHRSGFLRLPPEDVDGNESIQRSLGSYVDPLGGLGRESPRRMIGKGPVV